MRAALPLAPSFANAPAAARRTAAGSVADPAIAASASADPVAFHSPSKSAAAASDGRLFISKQRRHGAALLLRHNLPSGGGGEGGQRCRLGSLRIAQQLRRPFDRGGVAEPADQRERFAPLGVI